MKSLGSERDLYALQWSGFTEPQIIERDITSKLFDEPAAKVRDTMLTGPAEELSQQERVAFVVFLVSLLIRTPDLLRPKQEDMEVKWWEILRKTPRTVDGITREMNLDEARGIYENHFLGYGRDLVQKAMIDCVLKSPHAIEIGLLRWRIMRMKQEHPDLVISDRPIRMWGRDRKIEWLMIPISPKALFVAGTREYLESEPVLREEFREALAVQCIGDQFRQARRFVVARDLGPKRSFLKIAEWNMRMPDRSSPPRMETQEQ